MDPCFSGEDLVIKTRKPYTITKQRERWTEEEHNRFLEALKLHGRAWQRIEEHIGTKTAIQIRSHAQKFFTKLEKEATVKGTGNALDIEIPPPRPKRKPANPYPRKKCEVPALQLGLNDSKSSDTTSTSLSMAFVKESEDLSDDAKQQNSDHEKDDSITALNLDMVAPCTSPTSTNSSLESETPERSCTFRQFVPLVNGSHNQKGSAESLFSAKPTGSHAEQAQQKRLLNDNILNSMVPMGLCPSPEESSHGEMVHDPIDETSHNCPRNVPVHILGGSCGSRQHPPNMPCMKSVPNQTGFHGDQSTFINAAASGTSENGANGAAIPPQYLHCHPFFAPMMNTEDYQSLQQMSSTFSGLVFSALAQNAALYAAASFASTMWPWLNLGGAPVEPSANSSGIPQPRPMNPTSSMAAIAGATVAAATAWWAANGMFPLGPQYHAGFACSPPSAAAAQTAGSQSGNVNGEARESGADPTLQCQQPDGKLFNALHSASKPPTSSSSDSEASEAEKLNGRLNPSGTAEAEKSSGSNVSINEKQMDRFSSGSNTLSSSEVEPDATKMNEENHMETMEVTEQPNGVPPPTIDLSSRRSRSNNSLNDPWKEVSQEGRLAFQALFSREVLPQSFPPSHVLTNKLKKHCSGCREDGDGASIFKPDEEKGSSFNIGKKHEGPLNQELGHTKAKDYRTGFRLYKRCSMEAKEIPEEHKDSKKLRL